MIQKVFKFMAVSFFIVFFGLFSVYANNYTHKDSSYSKSIKQKEAKTPEGKTYYTRVNIWYENPEEILSTNFHRGAIIPIGTEVKISRCKRGKICFTDKNEGAVYTLIHAKKHSRIKFQELFERYFSKDNAMIKGGDFYNLTEQERKNIKNGTIAAGMNKDVILAAYGYPPSHVTPDLSSNIWTYWESRVRKIIVHFKDNKVLNIEQ